MSRLKTDAIRNVNASVDGINLDTSGNVGLGTTSPNTNLHVEGTGTVAEFKSTNNNYLLQLKGNNSANYVYLGTTSSNDYLIANNTNGSGFAERLRITSDGKLGVGDSSPSVSAIFKRDQTTHHYLRVENLNSSSNYTAFSLKTPQLDFQLWNQGPGGSGYGGANSVNFYQGAATGPYCFFHGTAERLRINTNGNVGIGTTSPGYKLEVVDSGGSLLKLNTSHEGTYDLRFVYQNSEANIWSYGSTDLTFGTRYNKKLHLVTNGPSKRLTIDGSGNIGIGTTSPSQKLEVNGLIKITGSGGQGVNIENSGGTNAACINLKNTLTNYVKEYRVAVAGSDGAYATASSLFVRDQTSNATRLELGTSGDFKVSSGDIFFGTAGKGIVLGATSNSDPNTLEDYEEGDFTLHFAVEGYSNASMSGRYGFYRKIGDIVHIWGGGTVANTYGSAAYNRAFEFKNLPFTPKDASGASSPGYVTGVFNYAGLSSTGISNMSGTAPYSFRPRLFNGNTYGRIEAYRSDSGQGSVNASLAFPANAAVGLYLCYSV